MKRTWELLLLLNLFLPFCVRAEDPPVLKPKSRSKQVVLADNANRFRLEVLAVTPLGKEDFYESRFSTFGGGALFSIPILQTPSQISFYGSLGLVVTVSRLTLNAGDTRFTSMYFQFPLLGKALFVLSPEFEIEVFLGAVLRTTRYDSRSTADGGMQKVTSGFFLPEGGLNLAYKTSENSRLKFKVSYLFLGIGGEFLF